MRREIRGTRIKEKGPRFKEKRESLRVGVIVNSPVK
jgi:hypothetical protein